MRSRGISNFWGAKQGLAAIEFAFIAPVLIVMFFGALEVCNALICHEKVSDVTGSVSDLVSQDATINGQQVNDVFTAANAIMYPYPSAAAQIIVTSIKPDPAHVGKYIVDWSVAQNTNPHATGAPMNVPTGLITTGSSVIFSEVTYIYQPLTSELTGPITMTDSFYTHPRQSATVVYTP